MERDRFHVETSAPEDRGDGTRRKQPRLRVRFDGASDRLEKLLSERIRDDLDTASLDVSFRILSVTDESATGVLYLTNSETGTYVLEVNASPAVIEEFVNAVREYSDRLDQPPAYRLEITAKDTGMATFTVDGLLVYDADGLLQRHISLILSGVEL